MLAATVEAMGSEMGGLAMDMIAEGLASFPDQVIRRALQRCAMEIRGKDGYPPRLALADILDRCGIVNAVDVTKADAILAWEEGVRIARRHADRDSITEQWSLVPRTTAYKEREGGGWGCDPIPVPEISPRLRDCVRRVGGWGVLKHITDAENKRGEKTESFVKRDFLAAYAEWDKVESRRQEPNRLGTGELSPVGLLGDGILAD